MSVPLKIVICLAKIMIRIVHYDESNRRYLLCFSKQHKNLRVMATVLSDQSISKLLSIILTSRKAE